MRSRGPLRLDRRATQHLHGLVNPARNQLGCSDTEALADGLDGLIDQFPMPAIVANRYQDVSAANPIARALSPGFMPGRNFLCWRLLDPAAREFFVDWDEATDIAVSGLRESAGSCPDDPRMRSLIDDLSAVSSRFRELWGRAVVGCRLGIHHLRHPQVGELYLYRNQLNVPYSGGQHVIFFRADPGSDSARALEELRSLAAMPSRGSRTRPEPALG
jgi:MmyB-like transcription regulator ligand binding domain